MRLNRHRAERCIETLHSRLVMTAVAVSFQREPRELGGCRALMETQFVERDAADGKLDRQAQIRRQLDRAGVFRRGRNACIDRADVQIIDAEPQRRARQLPSTGNAVHGNVRSLAVQAFPVHVAQSQAGRDRATVERAAQLAAEQRRRRLPDVTRPALAVEGVQDHRNAEREAQQEHKNDAAQPFGKTPPAAAPWLGGRRSVFGRAVPPVLGRIRLICRGLAVLHCHA